MFKSKNNTDMASSKNGSSAHPAVNMISEESVLKGTLDTKNDVRIAGKLEGNLKTRSKCIVTQTGQVEGDIEANEADLAGTVNGEITVTGKLLIRKDAQIKGDINTSVIHIEEGAKFEGSCNMSTDPKPAPKDKNAPSDAAGEKSAAS